MARTGADTTTYQAYRLNEAELWWRRAVEVGDHTGMTALATLLMIRGELAEAEA